MTRYVYTVGPLPTSEDPSPSPYFSGEAPTEARAREELADAMIKYPRLSKQQAEEVSKSAEATWTDFNEYQLTARVYPR